VGGCDENDMEGNIWKETGRYDKDKKKRNKELVGAKGCPEKDCVAL
jgi:hypothetical protein